MKQTPTLPAETDKPPPRAVQTGALSGGQPGEGVNTSSSPSGQSNTDAATAQGVEYGAKNERPSR